MLTQNLNELVLFFAPHAYFDVHAFPEAIVADCLKDEVNVKFVGCGGILKNFCVCYSGTDYNANGKHDHICNSCKNNFKSLRSKFQQHYVRLEDYLTDLSLNGSKKLAQSLEVHELVDFSIDRVQIGRMALYEFFLHHKLRSPTIPEPLHEKFRGQFLNSLLVYHSYKNIFKYHKPKKVVCYNTLYSVNRVVTKLSEDSGAKVISLHAGASLKKRYEKIVLSSGTNGSFFVNQHKLVEASRRTPCTRLQVETVFQHMAQLFQAKSPWVYSAPRSQDISIRRLTDQLNIASGQKILVAALRSADERLAAEVSGIDIFKCDPIFEDTLSWLNWLIDLARRRPDFSIVARMHPREFPNKREGVLAESVAAVLDLKTSQLVPDNFFINIPSDNISIYDLFKITDCFLNSTSTTGLEAAICGIPVVGYNDVLFSYDPSIQSTASSIQQYEDLIQAALLEGWSSSNTISAVRWLRYLFECVPIDISTKYRQPGDWSVVSKGFNRIKKGLDKYVYLPKILRHLEIRSGELDPNNKQKIIDAVLKHHEPPVFDDALQHTGNPLEEYQSILENYRTLFKFDIARSDRAGESNFSKVFHELKLLSEEGSSI